MPCSTNKPRDKGVSLTERELECLLWSARGLSSKHIAEKLSISIGAVDTHCVKAARRLDASSRIQAVANAIVLGLIKP